MAELISVNVGMPRPIETGSGPVLSGIFKSATKKRVQVRHHNLEGDGQADLSAHGGENKAVYGYPHEHYRTWASELDRDDFELGQFGENLTTSGLLERQVGIGDVFRIGTAMLQVSQPRSPCFKLGLRHDPRGGNLMTPGPSDPAWKKPPDQRPRPFVPRFSPEQARRLRRLVRRLVRRPVRD
mgnify:CR=1 FL=1